jgi:hypothetical protein
MLFLRRGVPIRWFNTKKMMHEEVIPFSVAVHPRRDSLLESRADQMSCGSDADDLHRRRRIHVGIHFSEDQQQFSLELRRVVNI